MLPKRHHGYFVPGTCNECHLGPKQRDNGGDDYHDHKASRECAASDNQSLRNRKLAAAAKSGRVGATGQPNSSFAVLI